MGKIIELPYEFGQYMLAEQRNEKGEVSWGGTVQIRGFVVEENKMEYLCYIGNKFIDFFRDGELTPLTDKKIEIYLGEHEYQVGQYVIAKENTGSPNDWRGKVIIVGIVVDDSGVGYFVKDWKNDFYAIYSADDLTPWTEE